MRAFIVTLILTFSGSGTEVDKVLQEFVKRGYQLSAKEAGFTEREPGKGHDLLTRYSSIPEEAKYKKYWEHAPHNREKWQGLSPKNRQRVVKAFLHDEKLQAFHTALKRAATMDCRMGMEKKKGLRGWSTKIPYHHQRIYSKFLFDRSVCLSLVGRKVEALQCSLTALRLLKQSNADSFDVYAATGYRSMLRLHRPQILRMATQVDDLRLLKDVCAELNTHRIRTVERRSIQHFLLQSMDIGRELKSFVRAKNPAGIALIASLASPHADSNKALGQKLTKLHQSGTLGEWLDREHANALKQLLTLDETVQPGKSYRQVAKLLRQVPKSHLGDGQLWIGFVVQDFQLQADLDLVKLLLACRIHQLKRGEFASDLQTLKKEIPGLSIIDPFTEKRYSYRVSDDGVAVSSAGPVGKIGVENREKKSDDISMTLEVKKAE